MINARYVIPAVAAVALTASVARGQGTGASQPRSPDGQPAPAYPLALARAGAEGEVSLRVGVDSLGQAVPAELRVLRSTHDLFARAAKAAVLAWRFEPAKAGTADVRIAFEIIGGQRCDVALSAAADPALAPHWYRYDLPTASARVTACVIPTVKRTVIP
jgi:TonB family protein